MRSLADSLITHSGRTKHASCRSRRTGWLALGALAVALAVCAVPAVQAETAAEKWTQRYAGSSNGLDLANGVAADGQGNVIVTGQQQTDTSPLAYTAKYAAADGQLLWSIAPPGQRGFIPRVDQAGDVVIAGVKVSGSFTQLYTAKYAGADGRLLWEASYVNPDGGPDYPEAMLIDAAGNVVITARVLAELPFNYDYYTAKYSGADGRLVWERRYNGPGGQDDQAHGLAIDAAGNVVVTGESQDANGRAEIYTAKYEAADGRTLWERRYNGPNFGNFDRGFGVAVDGAGDVLVTGQANDFDLYAGKYRGSDGLVVWETISPRIPGSRRGLSVVADPSNDVIIGGYNDMSFYVVKLRANDGQIIWDNKYLPATARTGQAYKVLLDHAANVLLLGAFGAQAYNDRTDTFTGKFSGSDGSLMWEQIFDSPRHLNDRPPTHAPIAQAPDGSVAVAVQSQVSDNDYEYVTIKYAVTRPPQLLWGAGRDLAANEKPDRAAETLARNAKMPQWSYGYRSSATGTALTLFTPDQHQNAIDSDHLEGFAIPGTGPVVAVNTAAASLVRNVGSGDHTPIRPGQLVMNPSSDVAFAVARWRAPEAGDYRVAARWFDLDPHGGNGGSAHFVVNGEERYSEEWTDGGKARLRPKTLSLAAGDTVDFLVGSRGESSFDSTAFNAVIKRVPKVQITSPAPETTVTDAQEVKVTVSVDHIAPIQSVELRMTDEKIGFDAEPPYEFSVALEAGTQYLKAYARDASGAVGDSVPVEVLVTQADAASRAATGSRVRSASESQDIRAASARGRTFKSAAHGAWEDAHTWHLAAGGPIPGPNDHAVINHDIFVTASVEVKNLTVNRGLFAGVGSPGVITVNGNVTVNGRMGEREKPDTIVTLVIGPQGKFSSKSGSAELNYVRVINEGQTRITNDIAGVGSTFVNHGVLYVAPDPLAGAALRMPLESYTQNGGQTLIGYDAALAVKTATVASGDLSLSSRLVGQDGGSLVGQDGGSLVGQDGGSLVGQDGGSLVGQDGGSLVGQDGGSLVGNDGASLVGQDGGSLIGNNGSMLLDPNRSVAKSQLSVKAATSQEPTNLVITGGIISGTGEIRGNVTNQGGFISPGNSVGGILVSGDYKQETAGTLLLEIGGTATNPLKYDIFQVRGVAALGGKLIVRAIDGYTPASGDAVSPLLYGSRTGSFETVSPNAQVSFQSGGMTTQLNGPNPPAPKALNIATRMRVETGDNVLIAGFIVTGSQPKKVLIRGIGPSLPVSGALADPILELDGGAITNDDWRSDQEGEISETTIPPSSDLESAIVATLAPGAHTAVLRGKNNGTGVGLVEVYDLESGTPAQLANISTRGQVQTGDDVMIGGFIIAGDYPAKVLLRAIGPSLPVDGALQDPTLELVDGQGNTISNDSWRATQEAEIIATTVPPTNDREAAIVATLVPGAYTAVVRGKDDTIGVALVEGYNLQ